MKTNYSFYLYVLFLNFAVNGLVAQELNLKLNSLNKTEVTILKKIDYQKKHKDSISIYKEIITISTYLKKKGYFTNSFDSLSKQNKDYLAYFTLNEKIDSVIINLNKDIIELFENFKIQNSSITIPVERIEKLLLDTSIELDKKGKSFSKVKLVNTIIQGKKLFTEMEIYQSEERTIDKTITKGYSNFPKSFLKNYFNINAKTLFGQKTLNNISKASKSISFIKEIKPPEILFTKDSTILYLYFEKYKNNSFDGIVNFTSKENGDGLLFNGNIDLKLNNTFNLGEKFEFLWNSANKKRSEFKIKTEIPYIFNSKISPEISFSIFKQDSTFLNTKFESNLFYNINGNSKIGITYNSESSENLETSIESNIASFHNYFMGFQYNYKISRNDVFLDDKINLAINPSLGRRITENSLNQFKIEISASYIYDINSRNSIFIQNKTGYLNSDSFVNNELFMIGGANSIRGFNEQSIFTNNYSYFNLEYRYLTSLNSYFYTISDFGNAKISSKDTFLIGLGIGYRFKTKNSLINISTALNKDGNSSFDFKTTQLLIGWANYF